MNATIKNVQNKGMRSRRYSIRTSLLSVYLYTYSFECINVGRVHYEWISYKLTCHQIVERTAIRIFVETRLNRVGTYSQTTS